MLILVSVITVSINTLPDLSPSVQVVLSWSEVVIVGLFTIEYGLRIGTAPSKLRYALSFHGIVDLARKNHRFSSRGRQDAVVAGRTDRKSAYALAKA